MGTRTKWVHAAAAAVLGLALLLGAAGCASNKLEAESWRLPVRESPQAGMIIGRLDFPDNERENPEHLRLKLRNVEFRNVKQVVGFGNRGEKNYIMDNNWFVVPNLEPGTYRFISFLAGNVYHGLRDAKQAFTFTLGPGEIKFIGSYDYLQYEQSLLQKLGKTFEYSLRKAEKPTELEMLQWLHRISAGSGWEEAIRKRIRELGGRPSS